MNRTLIFVIPFLLAFACGTMFHAEAVRSERIEHARVATETATSIVRSLELQVATGAIDLETAQRIARDTLSAVRYDGHDGYLFGYTPDGVVVLHGKNAALVGKNLWTKQDPEGRLMIQELIAAAKSNPAGGYSTFSWANTGEPPREKTAYTMMSGSWGWVIGTGVYADTMDDIRFAAETIAGFAIGLGLLVLLAPLFTHERRRRDEDDVAE